MHNFLKHTIAKIMFGSQLEWDDAIINNLLLADLKYTLNSL